MARQDYAQKRRASSSASRKAPPRKQPPPPPRRPWGLALISLIALGGLGVLIYLLIQTPGGAPAAKAPLAAPVAKVEKPAPAKPVVKAEPTPDTGSSAKSSEKSGERFEFYKMLPKSTVETPEVSAYKSTPKTAKLETKILLQAGSFRNADDAEQMRAQMILAGLPNVSTSRTEGSNGIWYRVRTGPFNTRAEVNQATNKLYTLNIHPLEIRAE